MCGVGAKMSSSDDYQLGPDIDLDTEVVLLPSGERLTETRATELADETIYLLASPENARRLVSAIERLEAGGGTQHELAE
jgi:hypothetical protein